MSHQLTVTTGQFRFNIIHLLILTAVIIVIVVLSNIVTVKHVAETAPDFTVSDAQGLMEEIYDAGTITNAVNCLPLSAAIIKKMSAEIEGKLLQSADYPDCEVYNLVVRQVGAYPVLGYGNEVLAVVNLKGGDIWKVGMTGNGEEGRYSSNTFYKNNGESINITKQQLQYLCIYKGTYKQCIILEKILIYTYSLWSGYPDLLKPPGCKIFR